MVQPGFVCMETMFDCAVFTPSIISISPLSGQSEERSQYAGQVPQPHGMCTRSRMKRPCVYVLSLVILTAGLPEPPVGQKFVVSTLMFAEVALLVT